MRGTNDLQVPVLETQELFFRQSKEFLQALEKQWKLLFTSDPVWASEYVRLDQTLEYYVQQLFEQILLLHFFQGEGWLLTPHQQRGSLLEAFVQVAPHNFFDTVLKGLLFSVFGASSSSSSPSSSPSPFLQCCVSFRERGVRFLFDPSKKLVLPNSLFVGKGRGILEVLALYSFQIREEKAKPQEISPSIFAGIRERQLNFKDRELKGSFYTAPWLIALMCRRSLLFYLKQRFFLSDPFFQERWSASEETSLLTSKEKGKLGIRLEQEILHFTFCDPAMGCGSFLFEMFKQILFLIQEAPCFEKKGEGLDLFRLKVHFFRHQSWGIEIDSRSVRVAHLRYFLALLCEKKTFQAFEEFPPSFLCGNLLEDSFCPMLEEVLNERQGFEVILGNPPYLKEKDHALLFQSLKEKAWSKPYYQYRMNYWYYFLHKAIELVRPGGVIAYLTSGYWLKSQGAQKLIQQIQRELDCLSIMDFSNFPLFPHAIGHHMVAFYQKQKEAPLLSYYQLKEESVRTTLATRAKRFSFEKSEYPSSKIFTKNYEIQIETSQQWKVTRPLEEYLEVSQGVIEAPPRILLKHIRQAPQENFLRNEGVFVLTEKEREALLLGEEEQAICYPYVEPHEIQPYQMVLESSKFLIYADSSNRKKIEYSESFQRIKQHLRRFQPIITSSNAPYGLHRARSFHLFQKPKLIFKNMFIENTCVYDENHYMFGFSLFALVLKNPEYSLKYFLALLNSSYARSWFYQQGKRRGGGVDIGVRKLRSFPVALASEVQQKEIQEKVQQILEAKRKKEPSFFLERELNLKIYHLYQIPYTFLEKNKNPWKWSRFEYEQEESEESVRRRSGE
jgi:hypothetical protein